MNLLKAPTLNVSIHQYLNTFPALKSPKGWYLLGDDFEQLYPNSSNKLFAKWPEINKNLIHKAKLECPNELKNLGENDLTGFLLLPRFLGSCVYSKKTGSKKRIKFTKDDQISEAFILHIQNSNLLLEEIIKIQNSLKQKKETLQPG